jgi:aminodeoxyfutalosine deaminase
VRDFIAALPKTELHVHLIGSASVDTVLGLARRHPGQGVPTELAELEAFYTFRDFPHFVNVYLTVNDLVTTGADVTDLLVGLAADLARNNVRYAEVTVTAVSHLGAGVAPDELAEALVNGRNRARAEYNVELAWIFDIPGGFEAPESLETVTWLLKYRPEGTVALGLAGLEVDTPRSAFSKSFDLARDAGLHVVSHAGETTGPETIWSALRDLRAERIGHGLSCVDDSSLLTYLAEHRVPVEVCPTSNICTRATPSLADHPLPRMLAAGIPVTLATDDPGMFHCDLNGEYLLCHERFGLDRNDLAELARTGVRASFCTDELRERLLAEIDAMVL